MKCRRLDGGIGGDNRDHGGHVGHDHARALAHSAHRIDIARMTRSLTDVGHGVLLGVRVGRHDGASGIGSTVGGERLVGSRNGGLKRVDRQNLANHARGGNQNLLGLAADDLRCDAARLARACKAGLTRGGVGIARVDRNAGDDTVTLVGTAQVGTAHLHGRRAKAIGGKHAGTGTGFIGHDERVIQTLGVLAEPSVDARSFKTSRSRNATLDGANLDIKQLGIHRLHDSLCQTKNEHRLVRHASRNHETSLRVAPHSMPDYQIVNNRMCYTGHATVGKPRRSSKPKTMLAH